MQLPPTEAGRTLEVSLVAIPDAVISTLSGIFDVMNAFSMMSAASQGGAPPPFRARIVGERAGPLTLASGLPVTVQQSIEEIAETDVVIVPSILLAEGGWRSGRYPALAAWLAAMHAKGALLCSACSGIFLLAETGLFDGQEVTVHYAYARALEAAFPGLQIDPERVLVIAGRREELITSGASMTWHDLVLYLIARFAGATAAQSVSHMFALQWHEEGLAPYVLFEGRRAHGDSAVLAVQDWLDGHFSVANPVAEMIARSGLPERSFKRRFLAATEMTPIAYVQRLRVEEAKRRLERTQAPVDEISWQVGYEDPAFFRRLFKRVTGITAGRYRRRFAVPSFGRGKL